jgi:neutral ceramidase
MNLLESRYPVAGLLVLGMAFLAGKSARVNAAGEPAQGRKVFRAGAAAIDITPQKLPVIVNGGFLEGKAAKVTDPLHARCLVLDDGTIQVVIAVVDNCVIPQAILDEAKTLAQKATNIPAARMLISATHCHSAPSVCGALGSGVEEEYARWLPGKIAEGIAAAQKNLAPAQIGWAVGKDPKNVFCRRFLMKPGTAPTNPFSGASNDQAQMNPGYQNPNAIRRTGPVDDDVSVLSVQSPQGRPVAILGNYSTHYAGAPPLSADYFGVFCGRIGELVGAGHDQPAEGKRGQSPFVRSTLRAVPANGDSPLFPGPPFVGIMSNGTSGDANCCDFVNPPRKFDRFTVGEDVAQAAFEAYRQIRHYDWVPLAAEEKLLTLGVRMPSAEEVAKAKEHLTKVPGGKPRTVTDVYARETVILSEMPATRELKLQAIRIGPLGIAAMPNEVFGSTGLAIKRDSPLRPTINIELANGYFGYLPPPDQFPLGGYTTWRARSSCLEVQAEPKIRAAVLELLNKVANQRRDEQPVPSKKG